MLFEFRESSKRIQILILRQKSIPVHFTSQEQGEIERELQFN